MKKFFLTFVIVLLSVCRVFAYNDGLNFYYDLSQNEIAVENIMAFFQNYPEAAEGSNFVEIKNVVDTAGYQHIGYQQYVGGIPSSSSIVLVHAYQGQVLSMNGAILTKANYDEQLNQQANISSSDAIRRVKKAAPIYGDGEMVYVHVLENGKYKVHKVYRVLADNMTEYVYVDVFTGEVVMRKALVYSLDVDGTVSTMYSGEQTIQCSMKDGSYVLRDEDRHIITLNARNAFFDYSGDLDSQDVRNQMMQDYIAQCTDFTSATTDWGNAGGFKLCLENITIHDFPAWTAPTGDSVHLVVYDASGNILETTECQEITTYPVTYTFTNNVELVDSLLRISFRYCNDELEDNLLLSLTLNASLSNFDVDYDNGDLRCTCRFNPVGYQPALDIHWGMQKTIDFYRDAFHHDGPDGKGSPVVQLFNPHADSLVFDDFPFQACALRAFKPNGMAYGMGGRVPQYATNPWCTLDVMAHEYTHLVTDNNGTGGLDYIGESGALNESFSDLMAMAVVHHTTGSCDWTLGEQIFLDQNLRSMSDPWLSGSAIQPKYYMGQYWAPVDDYSPEGDNGGVHFNSGVQNYWFYLLSEGGNGVNEVGDAFDIPALGIEKATHIAYMNLIYYLTPSSNHRMARWGSIQAVRELYGAGSAEEIAVTDAWAAVGVGSKYGEPDDDVDAFVSATQENMAAKILRDGRLLILRNGNTYTLTGIRAE